MQYGVKYNRPLSDKWESRIIFPTTIFVVQPNKGFPVPQIFGIELNGVDKCPLCGKRMEITDSAAMVSGGHLSNVVKWPWHASVYTITLGSFAYKCGGTMIQSKAVITAGRMNSSGQLICMLIRLVFVAHCVSENNKKLGEHILQVGFGENKLMTDTGLRSNVFRSIRHHYYDHETFENNIALLFLETQIKFSSSVLPICLPELGMALTGSGIMVGFGGIEKDEGGSSVLREVQMPLVSNDECYDNDSDFFDQYLNYGNFCAGKKGESRNICNGDSGNF